MEENKTSVGMHHGLPNYFSFIVLAIVVGLVGTVFTTATARTTDTLDLSYLGYKVAEGTYYEPKTSILFPYLGISLDEQ
jgi:hypothetical protein